MKPRAILLQGVAAAALLGGLALIGLQSRRSESPAQLTPFESQEMAKKPTQAVAEAKAALVKAADAKDVRAADAVANRTMQVGYALAEGKEYSKARQAFLAVDQHYAGAGAAHTDYGTIPDQAKYQAAVCLVAEGKMAEAKREFRAFLKDRPTSHLAALAFRRLVRLNQGVEDPNDIALMKHALQLQEAATKKAIADCGPLVVERYLQTTTRIAVDRDHIEKLCRQGEDGTTLLGLARAFVAFHVGAEGREVNAPDFRSTRVPFVWLNDAHFVLVEKMGNDSVLVWDPMIRGTRATKLPSLDDPAFRATILTLQP